MTLDGQNVLVAGGTGFIGFNLASRLVSLGCRVRATTHQRRPPGENPSIEFVLADLTSQVDCRRVVDGVDLIFMCAAVTSGAAVIARSPQEHVTANVVMNARMMQAAHGAGVKKLVWLSSNAAYPPTGDHAVTEDQMFDGDPYRSYFGVGWMKRYTETLCRFYSEYVTPGMPSVVIRPSNVYGPHDDYDFATSHVMAAMIRKVVERHDPIQMWGTGDDVRDVIYIDDLVDALVLAAERIDGYDPINVGLGMGYSLKQLLQMILEVDDYKQAQAVYDVSKPSTIPIRLIDVSKAERVLGFKARVSIRDGIRRTLDWYRRDHPASSARHA